MKTFDFKENSITNNYTLSDYFSTIYTKMFIGLTITALVSYLLPFMLPGLFVAIVHYYKIVAIVSLLVELGLIFHIANSMKDSSKNMTPWFYFYSFVNGITLSVILSFANPVTVATTFLITAVLFGTLAFIGRTTKKDLSGIGKFAIATLLGLIIATLVNIFLQNTILDYIITYLGVIVFSALIAYDNQKIQKGFARVTQENYNNVTTWHALDLYLDFINLFLYILRIMGKNK
jgi:FtsH-binding integral membrane protein